MSTTPVKPEITVTPEMREVMRIAARVGGKSRSRAKVKAVRKNLELARLKRWPKKSLKKPLDSKRIVK